MQNPKGKKIGAIDAPLLIVTLVLVVFGLIMMFSASFARAVYLFGDGYYYIKDQVVFAIIGIVLMLLVSRINYHVLHVLAWPMYVVSVILLFITLFMEPINNARRWIIIAGHTFQPSEVAKFAVIVLFAHLISMHPEKMKKFGYGFVTFIALIGVIAGIMSQQTHLSGIVIIAAIGCVLMFVGGTKFKWFLVSAATIIPVAVAYIIFSEKMEYAVGRVKMWLDPFANYSSDGYQTIQSLLAIGSGGLMGLGLGNSRQKHLYLPESQNDFVFSVICEELGFIGSVLVIFLFLFFVFRGFAVALNSRDKFGALLATGVTAQIGLQVILNIAVVSNTLPNTGISLPFFSQGGTSLVILLAEVGVLLSVSRFSATNKL